MNKMPDEFNQLAVKRLVDKLFGGTCFSICDFDKIAELTNKTVNHKIRKQLSAYHCEDYSSMSDREIFTAIIMVSGIISFSLAFLAHVFFNREARVAEHISGAKRWTKPKDEKMPEFLDQISSEELEEGERK